MSTLSLPSTPVPQSELVVPQAGAVVSRTLIKAPGGTVTAFAFDTGEALSEHSAPFDALVLGVEGTAEVTIAGAPHRVSAGDILLLPANVPHGLRATAPFKMILAMIKA